MPRRKYKKVKRTVEDPKYNDVLIGATINYVLKKGKKSVAENLIYNTLDIIEKRTGKPGKEVFELAINNVKPQVQVKSRRVGGATYQVPIEIAEDRRQMMGIGWLLDFARNRTGSSFPERLAEEVIEAAENRGGAVKKKIDTHKMAEANKAFSHYRF